jgi:hypothetical protein
VADAATFLTVRRNKNIATESLRLRLRGEGENRLSMEMFELLVEWMEEKRQPHCLDAVHALNERFGLRATLIEDAQGLDSVDEVALHTLNVVQQTGIVAEEVHDAIADRRISLDEADAIAAAARTHQRMLDRLTRAVMRLSRLGRQ